MENTAVSRGSADGAWLATAVPVAAILIAVIHLLQSAFFILPSGQFKAIHLCSCLILVLACFAKENHGVRRHVFLGLAVLSAAALSYIFLSYGSLVSERIFGPNSYDLGITLILVVVTLTATACQWGATLPVIAIVAIAYAYFGNYFPGELFFHSGIGLRRLASYLAIPSFGGLLGSLTALSATTVFIFMIFAGLLKVLGGLRLVLAIGHRIAARSRSGPALVAIAGSGFMGMMSGSTVANVASTGAITIPLMKKSGFRPRHAAAIEAVASTGGQFTPPLMGLTAFLIVGITGISYDTIMLAAVAPAFVYYAYLVFATHFRALAEDITPTQVDLEDQDFANLTISEAARSYGHLLFSIALFVFLLVGQMPPAIAALYAIIAMIGSEMIKRAIVGWRDLSGALRRTVDIVFRGLREGAILGAQLAIVMATIGILVDIMVTTGFAQKLSFAILNLAGGDLWLLLVLTALACVVFGLGLPTPAAYVLVALLGAPALVHAGIPTLHAHMFVFYFANMSAITPPVAVAVLVASKIAGAPYFRTCAAALQLGLPGFLLPFVFVLYPELLTPRGDFVVQGVYALMTLISAVLFNAGITGHFVWLLHPLERIVVVCAAAGLLFMHVYAALVSAAIIGGIVVLHAMRVRAAAATPRSQRHPNRRRDK